MDGQSFDLIVVGGGINGCGIARDAAGRGLSVLLVEQGDLASATSSASTKLIHGGLRYLEQFEFRLVREALQERERLMAAAPHLIRPLRFVLPHDPAVRPAWAVRLGLFVYDHLAARRRLPGTRTLRLASRPEGAPLAARFTRGFVYADCWADDSRLVVSCALDAHERGARIATRTQFMAAERGSQVWRARLRDTRTGAVIEAVARAIVNAAGPWVSMVLQGPLRVASSKHVRLVKGSHIVVPRMFEGNHAYILQNPDRRVIFAIPSEHDFTLIGTTDVAFDGNPGHARITRDEAHYLCDSIGHSFRHAPTPADIVWSFAGVRPLVDDGAVEASVVTRDYTFDLDAPADAAPLLSVFGGKLTTFRRLAEHAMDQLRPVFPHMRPAWTTRAKLPGGDVPDDDIDRFAADLARRKPFLGERLATRLAHAYGTRVEGIVGQATNAADLGGDLGGGLTEAEVDYLRASEWAASADDVLWRRSKVGLHLDEAAKATLISLFGESASGEHITNKDQGS